MRYVDFGKTGLKVSRFGIGCMRLPLKQNFSRQTDDSGIDEDEAIKMIRYGVDKGVNYYDTAYVYHRGNSEVVLGKALKGCDRESLYIADKLPQWMVRQKGDFDQFLDEQLKRLDMSYIDFYLVHSLDGASWEKMCKLDIKKHLDKIKADKRVKYAGFSFHGDVDAFKLIMDSYDWDMCQIQLNYMDQYEQAGVEGLKYAAKRGVPVVIMEPLRGGRLVQNLPPGVVKVIDEATIKRTPVEWAFRWLADLPEVAVVLSGVNTMEQLVENIEIFDKAYPDSMTAEDQDTISKMTDAFRQRIFVGCTKCNYCMPCPQNVDIPTIFEYYNDMGMYESKNECRSFYRYEIAKNGRDASKCVECALCEEKCPQKIPIIQKLKDAHKAFS